MPRPRRAPLSGRTRGFTFIELMVTVAVLSIVATVAFAGFRQDEYRNAGRKFIDDCEGALVSARNTAIDQQTRVDVLFASGSVEVRAFDTEENTWNLVDRRTVQGVDGGLVAGEEGVCLYGVTAGVFAPSQAETIDPPSACMSGDSTLRFEPDGSFSDPENTWAVDNAGATLWIADRQVSGNVKLSVVQVFPGGLIRRFERLAEDI